MINPSILSALAVLAGSSVGALTPVLSNYVLQRSATQRDFANREIVGRQTLYSEFITEATRLYGDGLIRNAFAMSDAVGIYALVSRMRLVAPDSVIVAAEAVVKTIIERYGQDNLSLEDLPKAALAAKIDPLNQFSTRCRQDLRVLAQST
ncbi:hypothetical protein [Granulicella arctica]|uniref:hypothetical protein n=1 Tax=Granulicella arctica TaxID=940613 RepID=UPI0021E0EC5F|nr:hypothetical protein [Granulicella arctica]